MTSLSEPSPAGPHRTTGIAFPLLTVWLALLAALIEVGVLEYRQHVLSMTIERSRQLVWLTPLSYVLLLGLASLALALAARLAPRLCTDPVRVAVLAVLAAFGPAFLFHPKIAKIAVYMLSAGIGIQTARLAATRAAGFMTLMRRTTPWMAGLVLCSTVAVNGWEFAQGRRARAAIGTARAGAPNILLLILDTVRAASLSSYGYPRRTTPHLDELGRQGVRFDRAIATAPWTLPAHATMFTGRYPDDIVAGWEEPMQTGPATLAEVLREHGYDTGAFVANFRYTSYEHGLQRGFVTYKDYRASPIDLLIYSSLGRFFTMNSAVHRVLGWYDYPDRKLAPEVNDELLGWLDGVRGRPFFAFLNYFDAHIPYLPPAPYDTLFGPRRPPPRLTYWLNGAGRVSDEGPTPAEGRIEQDAYDGALAWLDAQVGALLDSLGRRGLLENTIVVVTADHGEQFGEHGLYDHGNSLYLPLLHVPLLVVWPGQVPRDTSVAQAVTMRDLPATILDLAGIAGATGIPGTSLARFWDRGRFADTTSPSPLWSGVLPARHSPARYPTGKGEMRSAVLGNDHFIRNGDGAEELYDIVRDPGETVNLARTPRGDSVLPALRELLGRNRPAVP